MKFKSLLIVLFSFSLMACASQAQHSNSVEQSHAEQNQAVDEESQVSDPFEPVNRVVWDFNYDILDAYLVKPVTQGYVAVTPKPVRSGLLNFSNNLQEPANTLNNFLEGSFEQSAVSFSRFMLNSTVGVLGIFDVATDMGLERADEDFGQVLGVYGLGTGPYLMLPVLGPSDVRSFTGRVVDNILIPDLLVSESVNIASTVIRLLEARSALLGQEETLNRAMDQYLFVRDAYYQRLAFDLRDGRIQERSEEELEQEEDDFSDFEDFLNDG